MKRAGVFMCAAVGLLLNESASTAVRAEEDLLRQIPEQAAAVLKVQGWPRVRDRVLVTARNSLPPRQYFDYYEQATQLLTGIFGDFEPEGLAQDGPLWLVLTELKRPEPGVPPSPALIAKVEDFAKLCDSLDADEDLGVEKAELVVIGPAPLFLRRRGEYAIVSPNPTIANELPPPGDGFREKLHPDVAERLVAADLALYIDMEAVIEVFGDDIAETQAAVRVGMNQQFLNQQMDNKVLKEVLRTGISALYQFIDDSRSLLLTFNVNPEGLVGHLEVRVGADSASNDFLGGAGVVSEFSELGRLPFGLLAYSAGTPPDPDNEALQAIKAAMAGKNAGGSDELEALAREAGVKVEVSCERNRLTDTAFYAYVCAEPEKQQACKSAELNLLEPGAGVGQGLILHKPQISPKDVTYRNIAFDRVTTDWDLKGMVLTLGQSETALRSIGAKETTQTWLGHDETTCYEITADNWESARKMLDGYLDKSDILNDAPEFHAARRRLPAQSSSIMLEEVGAYMQAMARAMNGGAQSAGNLPDFMLPKIPAPLPGFRAYYGFSYTLQPEYVAVDAWAPCEMAQEFFRVVGAQMEQIEALQR